MPEPSPFLSLEEQVRYLHERNYVDADDEVSERVRSFLTQTNFHYFLGYARNYRKLVAEGLADSRGSMDHVVDLVDLDHELALLIFEGLQTFEWRLRASLVRNYCTGSEVTDSFLDSGAFTKANVGSRPTHERVREQVLRCREPWVLSQFEAQAELRGLKWEGKIDVLSPEDVDAVATSLPLWSVVDVLSLGVVTDFILHVRPRGDEIFMKSIASDFDVSNQIFSTELQSLVVLRNLVAHHSRLWMRPLTAEPKKPKAYKQRGRQAGKGAIYVGVLALALFLKPDGSDEVLLSRLDDLLDRDAIYKLGICKPRQN